MKNLAVAIISLLAFVSCQKTDFTDLEHPNPSNPMEVVPENPIIKTQTLLYEINGGETSALFDYHTQWIIKETFSNGGMNFIKYQDLQNGMIRPWIKHDDGDEWVQWNQDFTKEEINVSQGVDAYSTNPQHKNVRAIFF